MRKVERSSKDRDLRIDIKGRKFPREAIVIYGGRTRKNGVDGAKVMKEPEPEPETKLVVAHYPNVDGRSVNA